MNRTSAVVALIAALLGAVLLGWPEVLSDPRVVSTARGTSRELTRIARELERHPQSVAMPAALMAAHACLQELDDCQQCHSWVQGVPDSKCLRCHETVGERLASRRGYHGKLNGACASCHADHDRTIVELDRAAFNHSQALYPLEGRHVDVECASCHEVAAECPDAGRRMRYLDLPHGTCADCHEDPHEGQFEATTCESCHDEQGFRGRALLFAHADLVDFPLTGLHRDVECAACHEPAPGAEFAAAPFRGLARDCAACHEDPHAGSTTSTDCASCHSTAGWRGDALAFDHQVMGRFALDAAHSDLACTACHASETVFAPLATACATCHADVAGFVAGEVAGAAPDDAWSASPHAGRVGCLECHDTSVAHQGASSFARRCADCHNARYADLFLERDAHLRSLELRARDRVPERAAAQLEELLRVGSHNYVEAERRLRALADG